VDELACPQCGSENDADANFCSVCGHELDDAPRTETHEATPPEPDEMLALVVTRGPNSGSRYGVSGAVTTLGRHPDSDVLLDDVTVSRRHAEIRRVADGYEVADVGSLNGTYLDGERIERATVGEGSQLQVGKYRLVVVVEDTDGD
jgi:hypothetical protein